MATPDEVRAALQQISRLADGLGPPFRRAAQILADGALTGPAAVALYRGMTDRHRAVQRAFDGAFQAVSRLAPGQPAAPPPGLGGLPAAGRLAGGDVRGGDPAKLAALDAELRRTGRALDTAGRTLGSITARVGLGTSSGRPLADAGAWASTQATDVRRRRDELLHADDGMALALGLLTTALSGPPSVADENALLARARTGDPFALADLVALQRTFADRRLAERIAGWWKSLSAAERQHLLTSAPGHVGALDGLPATVRDQANRAFMATEKNRLVARVAALAIHPSGHGDEIADLTGKLQAIADINSRLALGGKGGRPPLFLLGFDTEGIGHAIVSVDNPDTADNVVTFVPGLGTKLTGAPGDIDRALTLWDWADSFAPNKHTASIFWLGYDAPQGLDVATVDPAKAGATRLDSFLQGLRIARGTMTPAHTTLLGHSYGSLVSGLAAVNYKGPIADDVVFVGSPGVGVQMASQLGVGAGHVWAGRSPEDPIPFAPAPDPFKWTDDHTVRFGNDPTSTEFGGKRFTVDDESINHAHSSYWDPRSSQLKNIARIVEGQYGAVRLISPSTSHQKSSPVLPSLPTLPLAPKTIPHE